MLNNMDATYFTHVTALASLSVVAVHEILKLKLIPIGFANKYPVPTNILLSVVASMITVWRSSLVPISWTDWLLLITTIAVVAAIVYNSLLKNWAELRQMEGE